MFSVLLVLSATQLKAQEQLVLGTTPWKSAEELLEMHAPLTNYLERELGINVVLVVSPSYDALQTMLQNQQVDVGMFSSGAYVKASKAIPTLKYIASVQKENIKGQPQSHYRGVIVTLKSLGLSDLNDLQDKRFGFTDKQSSSGYIFPNRFLNDNDIEPESYFSKVFFLGKHDNIIKSLMAGSIDAGATYEDMVVQAMDDYGDIFSVIAYTPAIPFDAYAAGAHVSDARIGALQTALSSYQRPSEASALVQAGPLGFSVNSDSYYDFVRSALGD